MTNSQHLREQMWDLVYGLLEADESQALIAQIKSEPAAARLYAEVRLQADLVGYAARIEDPSLVLSTDAPAEKPAPAPRDKAAASAVSERPPVRPTARRARVGAWLALGAATALAALLAVGQFWPAPSQQQLAAHYIVTDVEAPPSIPGGLGNSLAFHTTTLDGEPQSATVDFAIRGREGRELFRHQVQTDRDGRAWAEIPGRALEPGVRLEVFDVAAADAVSAQLSAQKHEERELAPQNSTPAESKVSKFASLAADLPVQAEPQMAYVLLEEPLAKGDKPVNASVWNFYAFSGKPAPPETAEQVAQNIPGLELADEGGAAVQQGVYKGIVQNQAQSGALNFSEQSNAAGFSRSGGYGVVPPAEPASASAPQVQQQQVQQQQGQQEQTQQLQKQLAIAPDARGALAEAARSPAPDQALQRATEQAGQQQPSQQQPTQQVEQQKLNELAQTADGYARFRSNRAAANLADADRAGADGAAVGRTTALAAGNEGFANAATNVAAGEPINVEIPPEYAGKPLVVAANARGVMVANSSVPAGGQSQEGKQQLTTQRSSLGRNKLGQLYENLQIELPPEADGPIEVAVLDPASSPPQVVSRNIVYREPARKLQIDVRELKERFAPGERVQITLAVRDEAGRPAADTRLGVRLWNEDLVQQSAEQPLLLAEALQAGLPGATISQSTRNQIAANERFADQLAATPLATNPSPSATPSGSAKGAAPSPTGPPADAPARSDESRREALADFEAKRLAAKEPKEQELRAEAKDKTAAAGGAAAAPLAELSRSTFAPAESQTTAPPTPKASPPPASGLPPANSLATDYYDQAPQTEWFDSVAATAVEEPVELATNRPAVQAAYDAQTSAARLQRQQILRAIGGVAVFGGMALLVLIAILVARRAVGSLDLMVPSVIVSLASLLVGCLWLGWLPSGEWQPRMGMTGDPPPASATPALIASAETSADAQPSPTSISAELDTSVPPTIPLADRRGRMSGEQLERGLVPLAGAKADLGTTTDNAPRALADADGAKSFGGVAGGLGQPAPALAPPAPAASATAGQAAVARAEGAALLGGKYEGEPAARTGQLAAGGAGGAAASIATPLPASLYFNANLQTNDQGLATIEFTLPAVNSQYRLLIDALGNGRIGSRQDLITVQGEAAK